ncbi:gluconolactonase [Amylibacter kogurei]|uniref:Gluconolactonase n=1 Tax=Paramylibacter kogurei TaxID=1889778 RepID=A0A2G5KAE1_9RHOB|nr:SMP-30/gluconolactonase/LRE family protein [Amylibacter kogurei]PIB26012.1 gluconolactonase [Amylibacter kogurei]
MIFDDRACKLGEGPLWHPIRKQFFWFDINRKTLLTSDREWQFNDHVSAAGWIDQDHLLIASQFALLKFHIETGEHQKIAPLEADNKITRSNDGRADPWGGFWIGTMGRNAEPDAGAIYRYYCGELRQLYAPITISNAICFSPDRRFAYFTDTPSKKIMRQDLDANNGWPVGAPIVWLDLHDQDWSPDGAVIDADGNMWLAKWGGAGVACFAPDGNFLREVRCDAEQITCPAFGGADLRDLYCTSATQGLGAEELAKNPDSGKTFLHMNIAQGQQEHQVIL